MILTQRKQKSDRSLLKSFERSLQKFQIQPGEKIVVGVSGGPDSVCLLHFLRELSDRRRFSLHVAHLNHGFRPEADQEARFVEALSTSWGIPITSSTLSVAKICKKRHLSKQEGARKVRYEFLQTVAQEAGARWIAVGHTADDQAETFLMRLLRGAGAQGLGAIPSVRAGSIIRPLLKMSRKEILSELSRAGISFVEDASNQHPIYLRNKIRHELLPLLERYNPKVKDLFCQEAELLRDENELLSEWTERLLPDLKTRGAEGAITFDIARLQALHPSLQRRVLRWGVEQLQGSLKGIGFKHIEAVLHKLMPGPTGKSVHLPRGLQVEKRYSRLILKKQDGTVDVNVSEQASIDLPAVRLLPLPDETLDVKGPLDLPEWKIRILVSFHAGAAHFFSPCIASFDFGKIALPLSIRSWRAGDAFVPTGMMGRSKKLQDFFVDAKVSRSERARVPLLTSPNGILWVIGYRVDERFRVTEKTKRTLAVEIQRLP